MNFATRYGRDWKTKVVLYLLAIVVALRSSRIADAVVRGRLRCFR